jgi:TetR/AcrR family transcriptional regulator, mexJK operon transcriptional repressor
MMWLVSATRTRKRAPRLGSGDVIRTAAAAVFLEKGYLGTSLDEIAAQAGVSKQTIYTHFRNKEDLFADLVLGNADRADAFARDMVETFGRAGDAEAGLRELARTYLRFVIRPDVIRLRRLVIAEAARFPDLARTYHEQVPERIYGGLASLFADLMQVGRLRRGDPATAAQHFVWLTLGQPLDRVMFGIPAPEDDALSDLADTAVDVFFRAWRA